MSAQKGTTKRPEPKGYREISDRVKYHIGTTKSQSRLYHWLSLSLQWGIPLLSAVLTAFASGRVGSDLERMTFWMGGVITILTVANSTIHPSTRFEFAKKYANKFWDFQIDLILDMDKLAQEDDEVEKNEKINRLLQRKNKELCSLIEEFNQGPSPIPTAVTEPHRPR